MKKVKIGIIFGGKSSEHEISIVSGSSIIKNLNINKYEIYPIYISLEGLWYKYVKPIKEIKIFKVGEYPKEIIKIKNIEMYLKKLDIIFPVLHGKNGEDGNIQGFLEILGIHYIGCGVLSSSLCMNKIYTKIVLEKSKIKQVKSLMINNIKDKYIYIDENLNYFKKSIKEIDIIIKEKLKYPVFIKPSNSGSSLGVNKVNNTKDLKKYLIEASKYDKEILIEEAIEGKEVECAVMGIKDINVSEVGEILSAEEFYSYNSKYKNDNSRILIPSNIDREIKKEIQNIAIKAFIAIKGKGLSRIDFLIDKNNSIYLNEINTMPGFTNISMYPKLWEYSQISFPHLLDKIINEELLK